MCSNVPRVRIPLPPEDNERSGAREAEGSSLLNCRTFTRTEGSNPSHSEYPMLVSMKNPRFIQILFERVPVKYRTVFYYSPVFLAGLIGLTWEIDRKAVENARRSFGLFLLFLIMVVVASVIPGFIYILFPSTDYVVSWIQFAIQAIAGPLYIFLSVFFMVQAWRGVETGYGIGGAIDQFMNRVERFIESAA